MLKKFIKDNNLKFSVGNRNSSAVILCGFALYKEQNVNNCLEAIDGRSLTTDLQDEIERVFKYARINNYGDFWKTAKAKKEYVF